MASTQHVLLSPAELAFLHESLIQTPPIRSDGRTPTQFRPLQAETGMLPGANGSARVCFADGTEAIVGVKAEVEKTRAAGKAGARGGDDEEEIDVEDIWGDGDGGDDDDGGEDGAGAKKKGAAATSSPSAASSWVEVTVELPGSRDDDAHTVFLAALLAEALLADGILAGALRINRRFHWKLYLDILLISPPLSYPLPLLSLTSHLALLATRLPRLTSEADEDPYFDDDWDASTFLYPRKKSSSSSAASLSSARPPITLLVMTVGDNVLFDPTSEELAVAQAVLAVSVGEVNSVEPAKIKSSSLRLLSIRTIDPPSRLTAPGTPYNPNPTKPAALTGGTGKSTAPSRIPETEAVHGVWRAPRGGAKVALLAAMTHKVLESGGVAEEVFAGLDGVEIV